MKLTLMTISTKVNSFTILKTKNQFVMLKKKIMAYVLQLLYQPSQWQNFPAGWPRLSAKIHWHLNYCQTITDQKQKHQSV